MMKKGVVGWEIIEGYGGEVNDISFFNNCSTAAIVDKIKQNK